MRAFLACSPLPGASTSSPQFRCSVSRRHDAPEAVAALSALVSAFSREIASGVLAIRDRHPEVAARPALRTLADPTLAGRTAGEQQLGLFLATGQVVNTNPACR
jgi:hypothetical protein